MNSEESSGTIITEQNGRIRTIFLNNPKRLNSITGEMADLLALELKKAESDPSTRVVILRGKGVNYSSGADLSKFETGNRSKALDFRNSMNSVVLTMSSMKKPVLAVLHGYSLGGGLEIAESADIRIAGSSAKIGQPEIKIGINAGAGGNVILPKLIGRGRALYLMLTGQIITAEQAVNWGLVDLVFGDGELFTKVQEIAESIAGMPEETVSVCKKLVYETQNLTVEDALQRESEGFADLFTSPETIKRIEKFLKR